MHLPSDSSILQFIQAYDLVYLLLFLSLLGIYHFVTIVIWHWFHMLKEANDAYYDYKRRCLENRRGLENRRRYEQSCD
jgi:hypothetical protein